MGGMYTKLVADMFVLGLPIAEKIIRPIVVYIFLIVGLRLAGKRELAQLNPFDLVVLLTISNTVQNAIIGEDNSITGGLIGAATLLVINYSVVRFLYGHERIEHFIEGDPDVLIENGALRADRLKQELITRAGAGSGGAQAGIRVARRDRPRHPRSGRQHLFLREEADAGIIAARGIARAPRRSVGAGVGAAGVARMIDAGDIAHHGPAHSPSTRSATPQPASPAGGSHAADPTWICRRGATCSST